jgi:hypothetical protein
VLTKTGDDVWLIIPGARGGDLRIESIVLTDYDTTLTFLRSIAEARDMKVPEGCTLLQMGTLFGSEISIVKKSVHTLTPLARLTVNSEKK